MWYNFTFKITEFDKTFITTILKLKKLRIKEMTDLLSMKNILRNQVLYTHYSKLILILKLDYFTYFVMVLGSFKRVGHGGPGWLNELSGCLNQ